MIFFFFQAEDGIRDYKVTGVQTCALPISIERRQTMFESIRKHSKFVMILLFLLIIPSFIFVGVNQNYFTESSVIVARVDGHEIKQADWEIGRASCRERV